MSRPAAPYREVRCKSGLMGSQRPLREPYSSFEEFVRYCEIYDVHGRLGYSTPATAWRANPTVQSSVDPRDLCVVRKKRAPKKI